MSFSESEASLYASAVLEGREIAGPYVRAACQRHFDDYKNAEAKGIYWDAEKADRVLRFSRVNICLASGEFEGRPFDPSPFQCFILQSIFGWMKTETNFRRFKTAYIETGKGSGKSPLAGLIGLYCLMADDEPRAEVYAAASRKDQAMIVFKNAVAMVKQSPEIAGRVIITGGTNPYNIYYPAKESYFRAIASDDGQSGFIPHCSLIDELHEHKSSLVVDMMKRGQKGRRQPLQIEITNSGVDKESICYKHHEYSVKVAQQLFQDDTWFSYVCALDKDDDPMVDESCWVKANPNVGISIPHSYLRELVNQAKGMPAAESDLRRYNFCQWVDADNPWIDGKVWYSAESQLTMADMAGAKCIAAAIDLSGTKDMTALAMLFKHPGDDTLYAAAEFWTPGDTLHQRAITELNNQYITWHDQGFLKTTPGRMVDYSFVAQRLSEIQSDYGLSNLAFDPYRIKYLEMELEAAGVELNLVPHGQGQFRAAESGLWMPNSIEQLEKLLFHGKIRLLYNPILRWNAASAVIEQDAKENRVFAKRKSKGRIDGVVALAMAVGLMGIDSKEPNLNDFIFDPIKF